MDELLEYDGLIYSIKKYDREDLYQVSMIGLIDALKHYDSKYNTKFSTFAYYYIVGEINKYIRENSSLKVSKNLVDLKNKVLKSKEIISQKLGREATNLEVSLYLEVSEELVNEALSYDEVTSLEDSQFEISSYDNTSAEILDLKNELDELSEKERKLIYSRYYEGLTQNETSKVLRISQVQVSRNEDKILKKLKTRL